MSKKQLDAKAETLEKLRTKRAIDIAVKETIKAQGGAIAQRFGLNILGIGFLLGLAAGFIISAFSL